METGAAGQVHGLQTDNAGTISSTVRVEQPELSYQNAVAAAAAVPGEVRVYVLVSFP